MTSTSSEDTVTEEVVDMYTFERIFRTKNDAVLFAVCVENAGRHVAIKRWAADNLLAQVVFEFFYNDYTDRLRALRTASSVAYLLARGRPDDAAVALRAAGYEQPVEPESEREPTDIRDTTAQVLGMADDRRGRNQ